MRKHTQLILLFTVLFALSSCSSSNTVKQLQREYDHHKYSVYVKDNLKQQPILSQTEMPRAGSLNDKKLALLKRQLNSRKNRASGDINGAIYQNGLYRPSRSLQQQVSKLKNEQQAESWLKNHLNLNAILALVLRNNLDIKSSKEQAQATLAKYDQVGFLDDMLSQYAAFTKDIQLTGSTQQHKKKSVSAGFPFPGLLALKSSIIDQSVEASRLALKQTTQDAITKTRIAFYELQFAQQSNEITKKNIKLLHSLREELKNSYSTNSAELSGILQVDIEVANNKNMLQVSNDQQQAQQARLNALLHISPEFTFARLAPLRATPFAENTQSLIKKGKQHRIEIAKLQTDLVKMKRIIQLSEKRFYPDFDAGFSRFQNDEFTTRPKIKKSNFFAKNDAYLTETKQKYRALQSKISALKNKTADEIQQALSSYQKQQRTYQLYQKSVLPKARSVLDIAKNRYETGEGSYGDISDAKEAILSYQLLSLRAIKGMNVSKAKLIRLVGMR